MRRSIAPIIVAAALLAATAATSQGLSVTTDGFEAGVRKGTGDAEAIKQRRDAELEAQRQSMPRGPGQPFGCKFCCEGQFGFCRNDKIQVNTPETSMIDAQEYVRKEYKKFCAGYSFYGGGGGTASVGYPSCDISYYKKK